MQGTESHDRELHAVASGNAGSNVPAVISERIQNEACRLQIRIFPNRPYQHVGGRFNDRNQEVPASVVGLGTFYLYVHTVDDRTCANHAQCRTPRCLTRIISRDSGGAQPYPEIAGAAWQVSILPLCSCCI